MFNTAGTSGSTFPRFDITVIDHLAFASDVKLRNVHHICL